MRADSDLFAKFSQGDESAEAKAMRILGLNRYCCRRMIMTHVDLIEKLLKYAPSQLTLTGGNGPVADYPATCIEQLSPRLGADGRMQVHSQRPKRGKEHVERSAWRGTRWL